MEISEELLGVLSTYGNQEALHWLSQRIQKLESDKSVKDLFMTYSILASKFNADPIAHLNSDKKIIRYLISQNANYLEIARIYFLIKILEIDEDFFGPKVSNIIQVADTGELVAFLKFLVLLPNPERFKAVAVEALRTNIATVFDAITLNNPYPAKYFNDQQWNQMYLKAAFMERDLSLILSVDERGNEDLARIISDYAHERWAASRKIDPLFWRPVSKFLNDKLLSDMQHLLNSDNEIEQRAAVLCCFYSNNDKAKKLLDKHSNLTKAIKTDKLTWNTIKD
ncbi:EboA domain-containing protein [Maribacter sp. CXY002]|uniref:EboA domain-containing protein n=1 Tax=Maribacter luteocoastalis TaxID=3407671 RepID=UPI003B67CA35